MTDIINLSGLKMNHFTELDAQLYCQLSNINPDDIITLYLNHNYLTDISGVNIFKNLKYLQLNNNKLKDLNPLSNLTNLKNLDIDNLDLTDELNIVSVLKSLPSLNILYCYNTFKTVNIKNRLKRKGLNIYD